MISVIGKRGSGKTTKLFKLARKKDAMVLGLNSRALRQKAHTLGYDDIEIIGLGDLANENFSLGKDVLVDESNYILKYMLNEFYGLNMIGFSTTDENEERN